ncbi:MAG: nuclear transport factor 2 family protein [Acidobacteriia bacterium]|nr:nuclear transport factor 2 family protein [Terriglobia bacterium]
MKRLMALLLSGCVGTIAVPAQTPDEDLWRTERAFERAITTKQHDAAQPAFHADFLGVDADGSTYTADAYVVRRAAESLFFDVEDEPYPGGGAVVGTVLIGSSVQRFSHVWLQTPQGWRLVAAQASPIDPRASASPGTTRVSGGGETDHIKDQAMRSTAETAIIDALGRVQRAEHASDANGWAALTHDGFWAIGPRGSKDRKSARMAQIGRQAATPLPTVHDVQVRIYGELAIMRYVQEPVRPPALRGARLWVRHGAVWQQALNHQTFLTQPASK